MLPPPHPAASPWSAQHGCWSIHLQVNVPLPHLQVNVPLPHELDALTIESLCFYNTCYPVNIFIPVAMHEHICWRVLTPYFAINKHYYILILIYHYHHFHCHSDRSDSVILPQPVGLIARPPKKETGSSNFYHRWVNNRCDSGIFSVAWKAEPTGIRILSADPKLAFGQAVVNSAWVLNCLNFQGCQITFTSTT